MGASRFELNAEASREQLPPTLSASLPFLLQLTSPTLPVGAYSYSEGLEYLVDNGTIATSIDLSNWIKQELSYGMIPVETAITARSYDAMLVKNLEQLKYWNAWLSAMRDTREIREQSWQMGQSLARLMCSLEPNLVPLIDTIGSPCNFATMFAVAAAQWQITVDATLLGYLHSWLTNIVNAGVKLIPLGQTAGQALLIELYPTLRQTTKRCLELSDDDLYSCSWGTAIASMNHETLYSRLFRS